MRFRRLSSEELFALDMEFKQFLVVHELYDEEWRMLAENKPEEADQFIKMFSDLVLGRVYSQVSFLVHFSEGMVSYFDMRNNPLKAYQIKCSNQVTMQNELELQHLITHHFDQLHFFIGQKQLSKDKADEVFDLILKGSEVCEESYFLKYTELFKGIEKNQG